MCGIVVVFTPSLPTRLDVVQAMCRTMQHRGPDDEGYVIVDGDSMVTFGGSDTPESVMATPTAWQPTQRVAQQAGREASLLLGHRRLAIVDLSPLGHQPMRRGHHLWAVYNGEIYNHIELRKELEGLGHRFQSHSDTEVLLAAYEEWGAQALERFNGMWALVIYDAQRQTLFVSRDRFGVKPLYVWRGPGGALLLASEIKALLVHPLVRAAAAIGVCMDFVRRGPQKWREETEFEGILRFPAGHWAELDLREPRELEPIPFWRFPEVSPDVQKHGFDAKRAAAHAQHYAELLEDAVRLRMRADVRIGTALSGGLDSSSIAVLVNKLLSAQGVGARQEVFSSVYRDPLYKSANESEFIDQIAQRLNVRSNQIEPRPLDVPRAHEHMLWALDTPPANTLMSSWHTFQAVASRQVVVTLDGQGADEQLAGYARYTRNLLVHQPAGMALREAWSIATGMSGFGSHVGIGLSGHVLRHAIGARGLAYMCTRLGMGSDPSLTLEQALRRDFLGNLQNLLLYADKTGMAWSVESRMPFMDYRLVEFLARVEPAYKLHLGWTKWLARTAMQSKLPTDIVWRKDKMGWPIPEREWFGGPLKCWMQDALNGSGFAREIAEGIGSEWRAPESEPAGLARRVRLLNLAVWHRLFFEESGRPGRALGRHMSATPERGA